jgi:hypothetical protein
VREPHRWSDSVRTAEFKIVYIAPMKALAAEMTANFSKRLQYLGIVVRELVRPSLIALCLPNRIKWKRNTNSPCGAQTGDMQLTKKEVSETQARGDCALAAQTAAHTRTGRRSS